MDFLIRKATLDDRPAIEALIVESARGLSREDYSDAQIEAAIVSVFGVDTALIQDGTYFVAEAAGRLVGCGGWSRRKTLFGGDRYADRDAGELDPVSEPAKIRAFFVHPDAARKGIGTAILATCESEARAHGFRSLELMATLPGVKLYAAHGYVGRARVEHALEGGVSIEFLPMTKELEMESKDPARELLRHTLATLAYRGGKAVRGAPVTFADFRAAEATRTPGAILAHVGDLLDWAVTMAKGAEAWHDSPAGEWEPQVARFHACLARFDECLAADEPLACSYERLFQGPIADALTHVGQIAMLRRMAGVPIRGENYSRAQIEKGQLGAEQPAPVREFD